MERLPAIAALEEPYDRSYWWDGKDVGYFKWYAWEAQYHEWTWVQPLYTLKEDGCSDERLGLECTHFQSRQEWHYRQDWRIGRELTDEQVTRWIFSNRTCDEDHAHYIEGSGSATPVQSANAMRGTRPQLISFDECGFYAANQPTLEGRNLTAWLDWHR